MGRVLEVAAANSDPNMVDPQYFRVLARTMLMNSYPRLQDRCVLDGGRDPGNLADPERVPMGMENLHIHATPAGAQDGGLQHRRRLAVERGDAQRTLCTVDEFHNLVGEPIVHGTQRKERSAALRGIFLHVAQAIGLTGLEWGRQHARNLHDLALREAGKLADLPDQVGNDLPLDLQRHLMPAGKGFVRDIAAAKQGNAGLRDLDLDVDAATDQTMPERIRRVRNSARESSNRSRKAC